MPRNGFRRFAPSILPLPYPHGSAHILRHYVRTPPHSFGQILHSKAESFPPCQCHLKRVALANSQGSSDFLGDNHPAQIINTQSIPAVLHLFLTKNLSSDSLADLCGIALKTGTPLLNEELLSYPARIMPLILQEISGIFLWFPIYHVSLPDAMNWRLYCFMKLDAAMVWL